MALTCPLCPAEMAHNLPFNTKDYLKHIQLFHAHQPNFHIICGISGCPRSFRKFHTYRKHISDSHGGNPNLTNQQSTSTLEPHYDNISTDDGQCDHDAIRDHVEPCTTLSTLQTSSALFLMGLKKERKLTQTALQAIVEGVTSLNQSHLSALHAEVHSMLLAAGVSSSSVPGLDMLFDSEGPFGRPFLGLETQHQQLNFYRTHFQLNVSVHVICTGRCDVHSYTLHMYTDSIQPLLLSYLIFPFPLLHSIFRNQSELHLVNEEFGREEDPRDNA